VHLCAGRVALVGRGLRGLDAAELDDKRLVVA
jgi:hypothetical protein